MLLKKLVPKKVKMVTTHAKNDDYATVVPLVTQDVVNDDEDNPSVSPIILFPRDLDDFDSTEEFVSLGQDPVDLPDATNCKSIDLYVETDVQVVPPKKVHREKDKAEASERKRLKRCIPTLEAKVDTLWKKRVTLSQRPRISPIS